MSTVMGTTDPMSDAKRNELLIRLLDALERYYTHVSADDDDGRRAFRDVATWFENTDTSDEHGFECLCSVLELDATHIRRSLARRTSEIRRGLHAPRKR